MTAPRFCRAEYLGDTGKLAANIENNFLLGLRESNPALLDMFRDRDVRPYRDLLPWSGEFAGKYLTGAHSISQITHSEALKSYALGVLDEWLIFQDEDGYLGCYSRACRLTGAFSQAPEKPGQTWDAWSHYHAMVALRLWHEETGNPRYREALLRIARLFLGRFYGDGPRLSDIGSTEMNLSVYHMFAALYRETGEEAYLRFCREIEEDLAAPGAGDYLRWAGKRLPFWQCPKPRWESLHVILGFSDLYRATGDVRYRDALLQIVRSILATDVHNTGAFSTEEQAIGHPFRNGNIETCCVVAFNALALEAYCLTGDPGLADFLERAHFNAVLGYYSPTGRWSTYNTPMDGVKCANSHSIVFQSRPGSPELNCCSVNAPRGVGQLSKWALTEEACMLFVNHYEPFAAELPDGLSLRIEGEYPGDPRVRVLVRGAKRPIALRIPAWSLHTTIYSGEEAVHPQPGAYYRLAPAEAYDLTIAFDFAPRLLRGEKECEGKSSVLCGPVLYAWDVGLNPDLPFEPLPAIAASDLSRALPRRFPDGSLRLCLPGGVTLVDFAHAGQSGSAYRTWLAIE